jgi:uncharacterized protein (TIGR02452 family)
MIDQIAAQKQANNKIEHATNATQVNKVEEEENKNDNITVNDVSNTGNVSGTETEIFAIDMDCLDCAHQFALNGYNPICLNMANQFRAGGGYKSGAGAQEENLFRRSLYQLSLENDMYSEYHQQQQIVSLEQPMRKPTKKNGCCAVSNNEASY